jgi:hypothetical protein
MDLDFLKLVAGMLEPIPEKRLTIAKCLTSEWMKGPMASKQDVFNHF